MEGGDTVSARRCTFMLLALALEGGLDDAGVDMLIKVAKPAVVEPDGNIQKKAYRVRPPPFSVPTVALSVRDEQMTGWRVSMIGAFNMARASMHATVVDRDIGQYS